MDYLAGGGNHFFKVARSCFHKIARLIRKLRLVGFDSPAECQIPLARKRCRKYILVRIGQAKLRELRANVLDEISSEFRGYTKYQRFAAIHTFKY